MVDHHIVGFNVAVHDPHTVAVVQSLAQRARARARDAKQDKCQGFGSGGGQKRAPREHRYLQKFVHIEADVVVGQLLVQLLQPREQR